MKKLAVVLVLISFLSLNAKPIELKFLEGGFHILSYDYGEFSNNSVLDSEKSNFFKIGGLNFRAEFEIKESFILGASFEYSIGKTTYDGQTQSGKKLNYEHPGVLLLQPELYIKKELPMDFYSITPRFGIGYRYWERGKGNFTGDYDETYEWPYWFMGVELKSEITDKFTTAIILNYQRAFTAKMTDYAGEINTFDLKTVDGFSISIPFEYKITATYSVIAEYKYDFWDIQGSDGVYDNVLDATYYEPPSETSNQYLSLKLRIYY